LLAPDGSVPASSNTVIGPISVVPDTRTVTGSFVPDPASAALNVVSEVTNVVIDRSYLLETNAALTTIPVTVS